MEVELTPEQERDPSEPEGPLEEGDPGDIGFDWFPGKPRRGLFAWLRREGAS